MGAIAEGLVAFAQPLLDETDGSVEQMNKAFAIAQICFNLALIPEDSREKTLSEWQQTFEMDDEEFEAFRHSIIIPMIQRHEEMFPQMHRRASTGPWESGSSRLSHSTMAATVERRTVTDRYAPCPCNSGKKYKFCCGSKGR